jgi:hypothetical protein
MRMSEMKLTGTKLLGSTFSWLQKKKERNTLSSYPENLRKHKAKPVKGIIFC